MRSRPRAVAKTLSVVFALLPGSLLPAAAGLPVGETVRHGDVELVRGENSLTVLQGSREAVIEWDGFSIGAGKLTEFLQPDEQSAVLNRVTGHLGSDIQGRLAADGRVILINPNGIVVGPDGRIDTAGFIGSTLDVADNDFLEGGDLVFAGDSAAEIFNLGRIEALDGDVFLIAREVRNEGDITAAEGTAGLAGGNEVRLLAEGDERLSVRPSVDGGTVDHRGAIEAVTAELQAAGGNAYALAVNSEGIVRATGKEARDGRVFLRGTGGDVRHAGSLEASSDGGMASVTVTGRDVEVGPDASVTARAGDTGGEVRLVGTGMMDFSGSLETGEEGFAEISGFDGIRFSGTVSTRSGVLLFDPIDFTVGGEVGDDITGEARSDLLGEQNVIIETVHGDGGAGDIFVNQPVFWDSAYSLGLLAHRHIRANASVQAGGEGELVLVAGWDGETGFDPDSGAGLHDGAVDVDTLLDNPESYGNREGSLFIGDGEQTEGIAVGSRFGATRALGHGIHLKGGADEFGRYVRLGFRAEPGEQPYSVSGPIRVRFLGELHGVAGKRDYDDYGVELSTVSIGHGLNVPHSRGGVQHAYEGEIDIQGGGNIFFEGQIGHGGEGAGGGHTGNISLTDVGDVTLLHLGHGGAAAGNHSGDIEIRNAGFLSVPGDFEAVGHLGHRTDFGDLDGDILIRNVGDLTFVGGDFNFGEACLGHGGTATVGKRTGDILIEDAGNLRFQGGDVSVAPPWTSYAQLGHGGHDVRGDSFGTISIYNVGDISILGGASYDAYAIIGHTGSVLPSYLRENGETGFLSGDIVIRNAGELVVSSESETDPLYGFVQVGHGGRLGLADIEGDVLIDNIKRLRVAMGQGGFSSARIGHGGIHTQGDFQGDVTLKQVGDVTLVGGRFGGVAQIGHGSSLRSGTRSGNISIDSTGANQLKADDAFGLPSSKAQIGHGGLSPQSGAPTEGNRSGAITIYVAGETVLVDGDDLRESGRWQIGHIVSPEYEIADADVRFETGGLACGSDTPVGDVILKATFAERFSENLAGGKVTIGSLGKSDLRVEGDFDFDSGNDLVFLAGRDLHVDGTVRNAGDGNLVFVADNRNPERPDLDREARWVNDGEIVADGGEVFVYAVRPGTTELGTLDPGRPQFGVYYGDDVPGGGLSYKVAFGDLRADDAATFAPPFRRGFFGEPEHRRGERGTAFDFRYGPRLGPMERPMTPVMRRRIPEADRLPEWDNGFITEGVFFGAAATAPVFAAGGELERLAPREPEREREVRLPEPDEPAEPEEEVLYLETLKGITLVPSERFLELALAEVPVFAVRWRAVLPFPWREAARRRAGRSCRANSSVPGVRVRFAGTTSGKPAGTGECWRPPNWGPRPPDLTAGAKRSG